MRTGKEQKKQFGIVTAAASVAVATMLGSFSTARAENTGDAVTVSLSGSTAIRNFTTSAGFSLLTPGSSITLNSGAAGAPITYQAASGTLTSVQLAAGTFSTATPPPAPLDPPVTSANYAALRIEWHEQGSVEGILELANDQIGYVAGSPLVTTPRNPVPSPGNRVFVNRNTYTTVPTGGPQGWPLSFSNYDTYANYNAAGRNLQGGQNRVQMAISDVHAKQGFSFTGTGSFSMQTGSAGFGKGNPLLAAAPNTSGIGIAGGRQQLIDNTLLNMSTDKNDPATGAAYGTGAWNSAGVDNLVSTKVAITATVLAANPGTGLTRLNRTDAQWLQMTGRLKNGADFNVVTRDVNSGTRNVAALNTGVDPSWAVGENDNGDGTSGTVQAQVDIGSGIKFSNKTAGGGQLRPTVQNSRMALGPLSMGDAIGSANASGGAGGTPLRALDYTDAATDGVNADPASIAVDGDGRALPGQVVRPNAANVTNGGYAIFQNQTYVTVKNPDVAFASDTPTQWAGRDDNNVSGTGTGIKGDNTGHDVFDVRGNVLAGVSAFPATSVANPGDAALANSLILPQMMRVEKNFDGGSVTLNTTSYSSSLRSAYLGSSYASAFAVADPASITAGSGKYGQGGSTASWQPSQGSISITSGNYLFGNFKQNGVRDFAAVKDAVAAQDALFRSTLDGTGSTSLLTTSMFTGPAASNNNKIQGPGVVLSSALAGMNGGTGPTKGDLIVLGDYNSDGAFDGKDLYLLARGAALADNTSTDTLGGTFANSVRSGVLRKNAALDYMQANTTAQQKLDARADVTNDPTGARSFDKTDVNRDGLININDAKTVDQFVGKDYRILTDQLEAVIQVAGQPKPIRLVDVELNDTGDITHVITGPDSDFKIVRIAAGTHLLDGDANFDTSVDTVDFNILASNFSATVTKWSQADFDYTGTVDTVDFNLLAANFGQVAPGDSFAGALVPEPSTLGLISFGAAGLLRRRRAR